MTGYGTVGWAKSRFGRRSNLGGRVGFHHKTLASHLGAFATSGLSIRAVREFSKSHRVVLPWDIAVVASKGR